MSRPIIDACRISKRFGSFHAIQELDFRVPPGAVFALAGPSGAGKSTAIKTLLNIHTPTGGEATVLGVDSRRLGPAEFQKLAYVSEAQELPGWMTVGGFFAYTKNFYPKWDDAELAGFIQAYELPVNRKISALSRGMRMKTALACGLAYHPQLLFLDEPFTALDVLVRDQLIEGIIERLPGMTVLLASHDLAEIESIASHICYIREGRALFTEEMQDLSARFRSVEVRLEDESRPVAGADGWLQFERSGRLVHFVESRFDDARTLGEIRERIGAVQDIEIKPMSLRSIFVALAKGGPMR